MLTERAYDEYRSFQEERLEALFKDMTRFYLGGRAEVLEKAMAAEQPMEQPMEQPQGGE